jgi:hypothetical protein
VTRLRESIEKAATAPLTEDERQELPRHFVGLAQLHLKHLPVQSSRKHRLSNSTTNRRS